MKRMLINAQLSRKSCASPLLMGSACDLDIESPEARTEKANIYKGKITRIEPSLKPRLLITAPSVMVSSPQRNRPRDTSLLTLNSWSSEY